MTPDVDLQTIKISMETMITVAATLFIACVAAAWALLYALVFSPLQGMKEELSKTNRGLAELTLEQRDIKIEYGHRIKRLEDELGEIKKNRQDICRA